jgi:glucose-6-phosphate 1-dehydrogenase
MPGNRSLPAPRVTEPPSRRQRGPADSCAMVVFGYVAMVLEIDNCRWAGVPFLNIAPHEGISRVKRPGPVVDIAAVKMNFRYNDWFPKEPDVGYETLLYDVMIGDPTLFMRADMVEEPWRIVQPVLDARGVDRAADLPSCPAGSPGPSRAEVLLASDSRRWRSIDGAGTSS